jgi:hypothetical protein
MLWVACKEPSMHNTYILPYAWSSIFHPILILNHVYKMHVSSLGMSCSNFRRQLIHRMDSYVPYYARLQDLVFQLFATGGTLARFVYSIDRFPCLLCFLNCFCISVCLRFTELACPTCSCLIFYLFVRKAIIVKFFFSVRMPNCLSYPWNKFNFDWCKLTSKFCW